MIRIGRFKGKIKVNGIKVYYELLVIIFDVFDIIDRMVYFEVEEKIFKGIIILVL